MTRRVFIKPARPELVVRYPDTGAVLPNKGARVLLDTYWRRRLLAGDVCTAKPRKPARAKSKEQTDDQL